MNDGDNLARALQLLRKVSTMSWRTDNQKYVRMYVSLRQEVDNFLCEFDVATIAGCCMWHNTGKVNRSGRDVWETSCGKLAAFYNPSKVTVTEMNFCMNCGKPIMVEQVL